MMMMTSQFLPLLQQLNTLQIELIEQIQHITQSLIEEELAPIHQNLLRRGTLLTALEQCQKPEMGCDEAELTTLAQLDKALETALHVYHETLEKRLNTASKQRCGLSHYALAGHRPAEILYRDEA
jgi:hypothetical protein